VTRSALMRTRCALLALTASGFVLASGAAWADSIDGNWCNDKGKQLSIEGTTILTPGGHKTTGSYSRHNFTYTVPDQEPDSGLAVSMQLVNEHTIRATTGQSPAAIIWKRCEQVS
jgi:hypothetical protein